MTTTTVTRTSTRAWQISTEAKALLKRFPSRPVPASWPQTRQDRAAVEARLAETPFRANDSQTRFDRKFSLQAVLDWLELYPGETWQQRWNATGAGGDGHRDWRIQLVTDLDAAGLMHERREYVRKVLGKGIIQLIGRRLYSSVDGLVDGDLVTGADRQRAGRGARSPRHRRIAGGANGQHGR